MTVFVVLLLAFFLVALTATLLVFVIGPVMLLNPRRRNEEWYQMRGEPCSPEDLGLPFEEFWFSGADGSQLHAWFIPAGRPAAGTILYLHGVGDNKISGLPLARVFHNHGYDVFLYDARAHGRSEGRYCTYGYHEKYDVLKAIDCLLEHKEWNVRHIGVFGTSMGAAVAVQASGIDPRIEAIIAEGCFTNLRTITVDYQKRLIRMPWHYMRNIVMKRSEHLAHFRHHDVSPLKALANIQRPILFIHGTADTFIKYQYSEALFAAAREPKELYLVEGANHTNIHLIAGATYEETVISFYQKYLPHP
jgi:uncharacterized protein